MAADFHLRHTSVCLVSDGLLNFMSTTQMRLMLSRFAHCYPFPKFQKFLIFRETLGFSGPPALYKSQTQTVWSMHYSVQCLVKWLFLIFLQTNWSGRCPKKPTKSKTVKSTNCAEIFEFPPIFSAICDFWKIIADAFESIVQAPDITGNIVKIGQIMREKLMIPWTYCQKLEGV